VATARLLLDRGDAGAAQSVLREALARLAAINAPGHWRIADAESLLGASPAAQGRHAEAEGLMRRAYTSPSRGSAALVRRRRGGRWPVWRTFTVRGSRVHRTSF
jgi:hypothetical protein